MFTVASIVSPAGTWNLNGVGQHRCDAPAQPVVGWTGDVVTRARRNRTPIREGVVLADRTFPLLFWVGNGLTDIDLRTQLARHLAPAVIGVRYLYATNGDNAVAMELPFDPVAITAREEGIGTLWEVQCRAVDPYWRAVATTAVAAGSVTNGGDLPAYPVYTLTPGGTSVKRTRATWTDRTGRGLANFLVKNVVDTRSVGATAASNFEVFYNGRSVPFTVVSPNTATTAIWCRVDLPPSGTAAVDIYYGSAISNTVTSNQLDAGQLDLANCTGTHLAYANAWVSTAPAGATLAWVPARTGKPKANTSFGYYLEESTRVIFEVAASGKDDDVDSITAVLGVPAASGTALHLAGWLGATSVTNCVQTITRADGYTYASGTVKLYQVGNEGNLTYAISGDATAAEMQSALEGILGVGTVSVAKTTVGATGARWTLTFQGALAGRYVNQVAVVSELNGSGRWVYGAADGFGSDIPWYWATTQVGAAAQIRAYVRKRLANQLNWTDCWSTTTGGSVSADIDVSGAVQLAIGVEPVIEEAAGTWQISLPSCTLDLDSGQNPTATYSTVTAYYYSTLALLNSTTGQSVTLARLYLDSDPLVIDCYNQQVRPTTAGLPVYLGTPTFTDPDGFLPLAQGANTLATTGTTPASVTVGGTFRARYLA